MRIIVTRQNLGLWAAHFIKYRIQSITGNKKAFVLGLPTGGTVIDMYAELTKFYTTKKLDFSKVITFNMDEYVGLSDKHPQSYHTYMQEHLFSKVNIPSNNQHFLNGMADDLNLESQNYEGQIESANGIDLFVGGVGQNGHIAFNEPGTLFSSRTHLVDLTPSTRQANARFFDKLEDVPTQALTVGIGTILQAKELLFIASGNSKANAINALLSNTPTPNYPITALKLQPNATLLVDENACEKLPDFYKIELDKQIVNYPTATHWVLNIKE